VQAKIIKLVGLNNGGRLSPINLVTFAGTQNGELKSSIFFNFIKKFDKLIMHSARAFRIIILCTVVF
jgi:hypothetical protein